MNEQNVYEMSCEIALFWCCQVANHRHFLLSFSADINMIKNQINSLLFVKKVCETRIQRLQSGKVGTQRHFLSVCQTSSLPAGLTVLNVSCHVFVWEFTWVHLWVHRKWTRWSWRQALGSCASFHWSTSWCTTSPCSSSWVSSSPRSGLMTSACACHRQITHFLQTAAVCGATLAGACRRAEK